MTTLDASVADDVELAPIPVLDCGTDFPLETLMQHKNRVHALFDAAARRYPRRMLEALDKVSRAWLVRWDNSHLTEIDAVARALGRPGVYFFSINYEWGCTCRAVNAPDGRSARLIRVLDWLTPGLGRNLIAVRVRGALAGPFTILTWPGYTGVLQVMAPGRFSAALNQAPMRKVVGSYYLDWMTNRRRVWRMPHPTPAHLLRHVSERAETFADACKLLSETAIATPGIYTIAGVKPDELAVIERRETDFWIRKGDAVAANHWESAGWTGHARGAHSPLRAKLMSRIAPSFDPDFPWLVPPILNDRTRLVMVADAAEGCLVARGYEETKPATAPLALAR